jgi:hypothetical protein
MMSRTPKPRRTVPSNPGTTTDAPAPAVGDAPTLGELGVDVDLEDDAQTSEVSGGEGAEDEIPPTEAAPAEPAPEPAPAPVPAVLSAADLDRERLRLVTRERDRARSEHAAAVRNREREIERLNVEVSRACNELNDLTREYNALHNRLGTEP